MDDDEFNPRDTCQILPSEAFKASIRNIKDLPDYLKKINQNIMNIEKKISKKASINDKGREYGRLNSQRKIETNSPKKNNKENENTTSQNDPFNIKDIVKQSVEGIRDIIQTKENFNKIEPIVEEENYNINNYEENYNDNNNSNNNYKFNNEEEQKDDYKNFCYKRRQHKEKKGNIKSESYNENKQNKLDLSREENGNANMRKPYKKPVKEGRAKTAYGTNENKHELHKSNSKYIEGIECLDINEPNPSKLNVNKVSNSRVKSKSPLPGRNQKKEQKKLNEMHSFKALDIGDNISKYSNQNKKINISSDKDGYNERQINKVVQKEKESEKKRKTPSKYNNNSFINNNNTSGDNDNKNIQKIKSGQIQSSSKVAKQSNNNNNFQQKRIAVNKNSKLSPNSPKAKQTPKFQNNTTGKMYSKEFPKEATSADLIKLLLFFNEYLIHKSDTSLSQTQKTIMSSYSKTLSEILNPSLPPYESFNNFYDNIYHNEESKEKSKKVSLIQSKWREYKAHQLSSQSSLNDELKNMLINNFIEKEGFNIRKVIGMMNNTVELFIQLKSKDILSKQLVDIEMNKMSYDEKQLLYKNYINNSLQKDNARDAYISNFNNNPIMEGQIEAEVNENNNDVPITE